MRAEDEVTAKRTRKREADASQKKATAHRVLPMELQIGDRLADETGEWEIIGRPYTTNAGKDAHARVQKVGQPDGTEIRVWRAHERVSVKPASAEENKR